MVAVLRRRDDATLEIWAEGLSLIHISVTFACGAAYFRRRSSLTILAPTFVGWYVASLVGKNFASVLLQAWNVPVSAEITIASLLIIVLFLVALF